MDGFGGHCGSIEMGIGGGEVNWRMKEEEEEEEDEEEGKGGRAKEKKCLVFEEKVRTKERTGREALRY